MRRGQLAAKNDHIGRPTFFFSFAVISVVILLWKSPVYLFFEEQHL